MCQYSTREAIRRKPKMRIICTTVTLKDLSVRNINLFEDILNSEIKGEEKILQIRFLLPYKERRLNVKVAKKLISPLFQNHDLHFVDNMTTS